MKQFVQANADNARNKLEQSQLRAVAAALGERTDLVDRIRPIQ